MPKYVNYKVAGCYLYFTSFCVIECMHAHASNEEMSEPLSAKFFVKANGDTVLQKRGFLKDKQITEIQAFIKENYEDMYKKWSEYSQNGFYVGEDD